jgi:hypothetical protein
MDNVQKHNNRRNIDLFIIQFRINKYGMSFSKNILQSVLFSRHINSAHYTHKKIVESVKTC